METTYKDDDRGVRSDAKPFSSHAADAEQKVRESGGQDAPTLLADVQDLIGRVAHVADPEIARLRARIEGNLAMIRSALTDGTDQVQRQAKAAMATGDRYVHERPWQSVGIAAAAGLLLGFLIGSRR